MIVSTSNASCNLWLQFLWCWFCDLHVWFCNIHSLKIASFILEILRIYFLAGGGMMWTSKINSVQGQLITITFHLRISFCRACSRSSLLLPDVVVTGTLQIMPTKISRFIDWGGWYIHGACDILNGFVHSCLPIDPMEGLRKMTDLLEIRLMRGKCYFTTWLSTYISNWNFHEWKFVQVGRICSVWLSQSCNVNT